MLTLVGLPHILLLVDYGNRLTVLIITEFNTLIAGYAQVPMNTVIEMATKEDLDLSVSKSHPPALVVLADQTRKKHVLGTTVDSKGSHNTTELEPLIVRLWEGCSHFGGDTCRNWSTDRLS